jgi:hypothetical protein
MTRIELPRSISLPHRRLIRTSRFSIRPLRRSAVNWNSVLVINYRSRQRLASIVMSSCHLLILSQFFRIVTPLTVQKRILRLLHLKEGCLSHSLPFLFILKRFLLSLVVRPLFRALPQVNINGANLFYVVVVRTITDSFSVFLRSNMKIVIFIVLLANRTKRMLRVGTREDLHNRYITN